MTSLPIALKFPLFPVKPNRYASQCTNGSTEILLVNTMFICFPIIIGKLSLLNFLCQFNYFHKEKCTISYNFNYKFIFLF